MGYDKYQKWLSEMINQFEGKDKEAIEKFLKELRDKPLTKYNYTRILLFIRKEIGKPFDKFTREDILNFISEYEKNHEPSTVAVTIRTIKLFFRIIHGYKKGTYPPIVDDLKEPTVQEKEPKMPTLENFFKVLDVADHPRDKAFLYSLWEAGARANEWLNLRYGDIEIKNGYAIAKITSEKTKGKFERKVPLVKSFSALKTWLDLHPKLNKDSYIWIDLRKLKPITYVGMYARLQMLCKRANVEPFSFHQLRHLRAKILDNKLSPREKMRYFGWKSLEMVQRYGTFTADEVCETVALLELNGEVKRQPSKEEEALKNVECPSCREINDPAAKFCKACGCPLREDLIIKEQVNENIELIVDKVLEKLVKLLNDKEVGPKIKEVLAKD